MDLRVGDVVYVSGMLATSRDDGHRRLVEEKRLPEFDLHGMGLLHAGPIVRRTEKGWQMVSIGPTTSMRMEPYESEFLTQTGVRLIIGKGGMGPGTTEACRREHVVHCVYPGGCAVLAAEQVESIEGVEWEDFGMPEAFWILRVKEFGPLIVSIDCLGHNLFADNNRLFQLRKEEQVARLASYWNQEGHAG